MKKVLLGLLALSAVSMAAAPDLGANPEAGTNVFQTGQEGAISITGKVTSDVPVVKYVVFGSEDGTTAEDTLILKDFILSQNVSEGGFQETNPKVYVKRVNGTDDGFVDLETGDEVKFKIQLDSAYTGYTYNWFSEAQEFSMIPTALISKANLTTLLPITGLTSPIINEMGSIRSEGKNYRPIKFLVFKSRVNGELSVENMERPTGANGDNMTPANMSKVETAFAGGQQITNAKILVKVD